MELSLDKKVTGIGGEALMKSKDEQWTMRSVIVAAFTTDLESDKKNTGVQKFERWQFADKVSKAGESVTLVTEEVAKIKERVGMVCPTNMVGWLYTEIEGCNG